MDDVTAPRWWKGARGEWYAAAHVALMVLLFLGPHTVAGWPPWPFPLERFAPPVGGGLMACGALLLLAGGCKLGDKLTPLPRPMDGATLCETGAFRVVRHPMYCGGMLLSLGWALVACSWLTLAYAVVVVVVLDVKSRREERWLAARFPAYRDYQRRVSKLIPFVY